MDRAVSPELPLSLEEYAQLPDDGWRSELVRGWVVREPQPGYEHGFVQAAAIEALRRHVREHAPELRVVGPIGVITDEGAATVRAPDVAVVRGERLGDLHRTGFLRGAPDLAVEVVSPSNRAGEMQTKVLEYLTSGATLVWVVHPETRTVVVHTVDGARVLREGDELGGGPLLPSLHLPVASLFAE
jgi:Uma2 family endonuclease